MKRLIIILILLAATLAGDGWVDLSCVQDCLKKGYLYQYCIKYCSY